MRAALTDSVEVLLTKRVKLDVGLKRDVGFHDFLYKLIKSRDGMLLLVGFHHFTFSFGKFAKLGLVVVAQEVN